ncbi:MAG: Clp protease ClpP, partial [Oscillospiraceae bacterium]
TLELYIYSEVAPDSYNYWTEEKVESETSADFFRKTLAEYPDVKYINLYINSFGGSVKEGYGIYSQLVRHPAEVTAYVDGFANSIASIIAMAATKIIMSMGSMMGIHNMMDWCFGNALEHRKVADDLDRMMEGNRQIYLSRAGDKLSLGKLTELLDAETMLTAQECLEYGLCDEIAGTVKDPEQVAEKMQSMNKGVAAQAKYFRSLKQEFAAVLDCPMKEKTEPPPETEPEQKSISTFLSAFCAERD